MTETTPVHVSMTVIRKQRSTKAFNEEFQFVLGVLQQKSLFQGKTIGINATTLEADAPVEWLPGRMENASPALVFNGSLLCGAPGSDWSGGNSDLFHFRQAACT